MLLNSTKAVKSALCPQVNDVGLSGVVKTPQVMILAINGDSGRVDGPFHRLCNSEKTRSVVVTRPSDILPLFTSRCFAQVEPPIVGSVAVDVVNVFARVFAGHVNPREAMREARLAKNRDVSVAASLHAPSNGPISSGSFPNKYSRLRIVMQRIAKRLRGKGCCNHGAYSHLKANLNYKFKGRQS